MKKTVLLPYDRYRRLLTGTVRDETAMSNPAQEHALQDGVEDSEIVTTCPALTQGAFETLKQHFPKPMQNRMRSLMVYIQPQVSWNDKGEVTIKDKLIPGSNIVDLIKVHLKDYKNFQPVGKEALGKLLSELNVPTSLLAQSARKQQQTGKGSDIPPPPGIPVDQINSEQTLPPPKKVKWLRL